MLFRSSEQAKVNSANESVIQAADAAKDHVIKASEQYEAAATEASQRVTEDVRNWASGK